MPRKPLPKALVNRLRDAIKTEKGKAAQGRAIKGGHQARVYSTLDKMKNIHHLGNHQLVTGSLGNVYMVRTHVREMDVRRTFPEVGKVVIKRIRGLPANSLLEQLKKRVKKHNKRFKPKDYVLVEPHIYLIGKDLVAMSKTNAVAPDEMLGFRGPRTARGLRFLKKLQREHNVTEKKLREILEQVVDRTGIAHLLVEGVRDGKLVFIPLVGALHSLRK